MHCSAAQKKYRSSVTMLALVSLILAAGTVFTMGLLAQTSGSGSSTTPADTAPSVTLSVNAASAQAGHRPGARSYYSTTVSDDKLLKSVVVTTSPMMYSSSTNTLFHCIDKTSCEEKVYIIVPSNPGAQFVTVTATDSAGQITVKTVNFDAPACVSDADCGSSGSVQWAGSSFCGSESGNGPQANIMQYGVGPTCKIGGICDTSSTSRVKQACPSGQLCTYGDNGINMCINPPPACTPGSVINAACTCGGVAFNYPKDWRSNSPTRCCPNADGSFTTVGGGECPSTTQAPRPPPLSSSSSSSGTASRSTLTPLSTTPQTNPSSTIPSVNAPTTTGLPATPPPMFGVPPLPFSPAPLQTPPTQAPVTVQSAQPSVSLPAVQHLLPTKRLKISEILILKNKKKKMLRELKTLYATFVKEKNEDVLDFIVSFKEELDDFKPRIVADLETMTELEDSLKSFRDALTELRR